MEKFRQFADESTGINPYIPIWGQTKTSILRKILGIPIFISRSAILSICLAMFVVLSIIVELIYLDHLRIVFFSIFLNGLSRVILFCFGCIWISENLDKSVTLPLSTDKKKCRTRKVIYVNRQGFCDIFVCSSVLGDPEYLFMGDSGMYLASNSLSALLFSIVGAKKNIRGISRISSASKLKPIYNSLRPLVVFMEEVNTNGTCILEWNKTEKIPDTSEMRDLFGENSESMVIQYNIARSLYGPQFTTGDFVSHLFNMLSKITHFKIDLKIVSSEVLKSRISRKSDGNGLGDKNSNISLKDLQKKRRIDDLLSSIQNIQGKSSSLPIVTSGTEEAQGFIEYWEKTNKGKSV
ncbi:apicomplexan conserved with 2 or more transmembrane domains [Cryptosporidium sp. chipmunk genotype I]|uniref:apicomplexan conserved with 2 or more transmembrane domains n=1 Tax=Cryptosporidium sp. chipmunk genotype I TaxID=1280935 RepID=UPI003519F951|nr:apicomplexan conserved with 2 or more transmembrane domains [Cryptosporidium sp. chipmunk genotype I]